MNYRAHHEISAAKRRGFVLLSVFVIVTLALLVVTGLLYLTQAEGAARHRTTSRAQSQANSWSAVQVVMNEINAQRDVILEGNRPELLSQYELFEVDGRTVVARLLPMNEHGELLVAEAGKLDLNEVDEETLIATGIVDADLAKRIIKYRNSRPGQMYQSVNELCHVEGLSPRRVFGEADRFMVFDQAQHPEEDLPGGASSGVAAIDVDQALADLFTVNAVEPAIQRSGRQRINLNTPWSDELGKRVDERFGEGASQLLRRVFEQVTFDDDSKIVATMLAFQSPVEDWPDIVDVLTTEKGANHFGRVDINSATQTVLAALPGIEPEQAAEIVQMRDGLTAEERSTIVWPALKNILEPETYEKLAGRITTRSWTYRLRIATGVASSEDSAGLLDDVVIYEIVVDLSSPAARVAHWRDITLMQTAAIIAAESGMKAPESTAATNEDRALGADSDDGASDDSADMKVDDDTPASDVGDPLRGESVFGDTNGSGGTSGDGESGRKRIGRWIGGG